MRECSLSSLSSLGKRTQDQTVSEKERVKEMRGREGEGEREVSGEYALLFTGAPLFPIIRCD